MEYYRTKYVRETGVLVQKIIQVDRCTTGTVGTYVPDTVP
jgi:hypothetical protein